jgi:hypothetical protein
MPCIAQVLGRMDELTNLCSALAREPRWPISIYKQTKKKEEDFV